MGLKEKVGALNINRKIELAIAVLLVGTAVPVMLAISLFAQGVLEKKSLELAAQQIDTASYNTRQTLNSVYNISTQIMGNSWIQSFLRTERGAEDYTLLLRSANEVLDNQRDSNSMLRFVAVQKAADGQLLYTGATWTVANFADEMNSLYQQSQPLGLANIQYTLAEDVFSPGSYSFYFFMPLHSLFNPDQQLGMLYICVSEGDIRSVYSTGEMLSTYLAGSEGLLLSGEQADIGQPTLLNVAEAALKGTQQPAGSDRLVIYQRLPDTGWYVVGEITRSALMEDFRRLWLLAMVVLLVSIALSAAVAHRLSRNIYRPVAAAINTMDEVAKGDLQVRLPEGNMGRDLRRLSTSFNAMVMQIQRLMAQVKAEQYLADKTKFNMLQSQIQPHFLYNVLDSIHWQAAYNKDKEVSHMVQKLADYYRLSLSRGNDIIPLRQELAMVRHYLDLQNLRYDNLVDFEADLPEGLLALPIPKMTLQPLVENAIYHGFRSGSIRRGHIKLYARSQGADVLLLLEDDGSGGSREAVRRLNDTLRQYDPAAGYGLQNVHKRFEIYFGPGYGLRIESNTGRGLRVVLRLPGPQGQAGEGESKCTVC